MSTRVVVNIVYMFAYSVRSHMFMDIVTSVITFKFSALNYSLILLNFQQDFYKINCDETFLADSNSGG
jgi:hypothetical protein